MDAIKSFFSKERREARGKRWMESHLARTKLRLGEGEEVLFRTVAWVPGAGKSAGDLILTNKRMVFRQDKGFLSRPYKYRDFAISLSQIDAATVGSVGDGIRNLTLGMRRLVIHRRDGRIEDLMLFNAGIVAEAIEAALLTRDTQNLNN